MKLIIAVTCFALSMSLFEALIDFSTGLQALMGHRVFLPEFIEYKWTVIGIAVLMFVYYMLVTWNEETDKFTVEM